MSEKKTNANELNEEELEKVAGGVIDNWQDLSQATKDRLVQESFQTKFVEADPSKVCEYYDAEHYTITE